MRIQTGAGPGPVRVWTEDLRNNTWVQQEVGRVIREESFLLWANMTEHDMKGGTLTRTKYAFG